MKFEDMAIRNLCDLIMLVSQNATPIFIGSQNVTLEKKKLFLPLILFTLLYNLYGMVIP